MAGLHGGRHLVGLFIYVGSLVIMVASIATLLDETRLRCLWSVLIAPAWQRQLFKYSSMSGEGPVLI
jgi:hypothetical protein